jgi:hypothetical protein
VDNLVDSGANILIVSGLNDAKDCNFPGTAAWLGLLDGGPGSAVAHQFDHCSTRAGEADLERPGADEG